MVYKIEGGFSSKDPDALEKLMNAMDKKDGTTILPFEATGWKSTHNSHLVTGKKPVDEKKEKAEKPKVEKTVKEVKKKETVKKEEVKKKVKSGDTKGSDIRGSLLGVKKKTLKS